MRPAMILRSVVLPHPLGPRTTMVLPWGTRSERSWMANVDGRPAPAPGSRSVLQTSTRSMRATSRSFLRRVARGQHRGQRGQRLAQALAEPGDVRLRLLGHAAARDVGDELLAAGRHQEPRVHLDLERVDAPGVRLP